MCELLDRVAVNQTRLRVPGVGLDARGVAIGARGLVLLPSLDRLVAFLALYTAEHSLEALGSSLRIEVVRSKLGASEITLTFDAGSSERLDSVSEIARLAGAHAFTGTSRHYVQYRDAAAPFGYDASEITATDSSLVLYHNTFTQVYDAERQIDPARLLRNMMPNPRPTADYPDGLLWVLAEPGLGASLLGYLVRSGVDADAGIAEWPPETSFDDTPVRRWLFRVPQLPARMRPLLRNTPGVTVFVPAAPGVAVELGWEHPVNLRAAGLFDAAGLVLFRGASAVPLEIETVPAMGPIRALARSELRAEAAPDVRGRGSSGTPDVRVPVRLLPTVAPASAISASFVPAGELELLRRLAYVLGTNAVRTTRVAITQLGAYLVRDSGVDGIPIGHFYRRLHDSIYVPSGMDVVPAVGPDVLFSALGSPADKILFFRPDSTAVAVDRSAFVSLETAILSGADWAPLQARDLSEELATELPTVWLGPLGFRPLSNAEPIE